MTTFRYKDLPFRVVQSGGIAMFGVNKDGSLVLPVLPSLNTGLAGITGVKIRDINNPAAVDDELFPVCLATQHNGRLVLRAPVANAIYWYGANATFYTLTTTTVAPV